MKRILEYPKFLILASTYVLAYVVFQVIDYGLFHSTIITLGYAGTLISGVFYVYGFTAAFATTALVILGKDQNIIIAGLLAGAGALLGDMIIFSFVRESFAEEIEKLKKGKILAWLHLKTPDNVKRFLMPLAGIILVSSPLPDEIGIPFLALSREISPRRFAVISYILNTGGIFAILLLSEKL
jgi:hypothetical protein